MASSGASVLWPEGQVREVDGEEDGEALMGCKGPLMGKRRPRYGHICELLREFELFPLPLG